MGRFIEERTELPCITGVREGLAFRPNYVLACTQHAAPHPNPTTSAQVASAMLRAMESDYRACIESEVKKKKGHMQEGAVVQEGRSKGVPVRKRLEQREVYIKIVVMHALGRVRLMNRLIA